MDYKLVCGTLSVLVGCLQYGVYIRDILAHKTKPHAFSWFVWGFPCGIVFIAQLVKGGGMGSWATGISTLLCSSIFILSLFRGEKTVTLLDWLALVMAMMAILLWVITKDPLASVVLVTVADVLGFIPTLRKSIAKPGEETVSMYLIGNVKWLLSMAALGAFSATTLLYPASMLAANGLMALFLLYRRKLA